MAFANFGEPQQQAPEQQPFRAEPVNLGKKVGQAYLYMAIGLLITALSSLATGLGFGYWLLNASDPFIPSIAFLAIGIGALVGMLAIPFTMASRLRNQSKSIWPGFVVYSLFMGVFLSYFLVWGVDFYVFAEAFGISALAFASAGLWGYFSKKDMNRLWLFIGFVGIAILLLTLFSLLTIFVFPTASYLISLGTMFAMVLVTIVIAAIDTFNIKRILANGENSSNLTLYCAFMMYSDFISIFIRVLYILLLTSRRD